MWEVLGKELQALHGGDTTPLPPSFIKDEEGGDDDGVGSELARKWRGEVVLVQDGTRVIWMVPPPWVAAWPGCCSWVPFACSARAAMRAKLSRFYLNLVFF
jgi:hypothetical protein